MSINREQFDQWKADLVTQAFYEALSDYEAGALESLRKNVAEDVPNCWYQGVLHAVEKIKEFDLEEANND